MLSLPANIQPRGPRRRTLSVDDGHLSIARGIDDDRSLAAEPEMRNLDDCRSENGRDPRIDGVAARCDHLGAGIDGERSARRDHAMRRSDLAAHLSAFRGRRLLRNHDAAGQRHRGTRTKKDRRRNHR